MQRGGEGQPLLLAAGEPADGCPAERVYAEPLHQFVERPRIAVHAGDVAEEGKGAGRRREAAVLEHHPYAGPQFRTGGAGIFANREMVPPRALLKALRASMVVVLPAPLAPSSAVTSPRPAMSETSLTTLSILPSRVGSGPTSLTNPLMDSTGDSGDRTPAFYVK